MSTIEQQKAAQYLWDSPTTALQLVAGAGSGKTTTLIETVQNAQEHFDNEKIALITFTKKSAQEMSERLQKNNKQAGFVGTMHSLAWKILREHHQDDYVIKTDLKEELHGLVKKLFPQFSHIPTDILLEKNFLTPQERLQLHDAFSLLKKEKGFVQLDDLIPLAARFLQENPLPLYQVVFIDEFQDTSPDQIEFVKALDYQKLFAVGDDWQSIYKFRGAEINNSLRFKEFFPNAERLFLTKNFRSQKNIVLLGNKMIRLSSSFINKKLHSFHVASGKVTLHIEKKFKHMSESWKKLEKLFLQRFETLTVLVRTNSIRLSLERLLSPEQKKRIDILTIHSSKGLEFDHVVIFALAHHILPHRNNDDFDEEVRLLYVAITRAKKTLDIVAWENNNKWSPFLPALVRHCSLRYF